MVQPGESQVEPPMSRVDLITDFRVEQTRKTTVNELVDDLKSGHDKLGHDHKCQSGVFTSPASEEIL